MCIDNYHVFLFSTTGTSAPGEGLKEERINESVIASFNPNVSLSIHQQRERLPIFKHRTTILYCVERFQTTIIIGETGRLSMKILLQFVA